MLFMVFHDFCKNYDFVAIPAIPHFSDTSAAHLKAVGAVVQRDKCSTASGDETLRLVALSARSFVLEGTVCVYI